MIKITIYIICLFLCMITSAMFADDDFFVSSIDEAKLLSSQTKQPLLIVFGADYCDACRQLKTDLMNELKSDVEKYIICYIDVSQNENIKTQYNIVLIPESRIYIDGEYRFYMKGYSKIPYERWLNNVR